MCLLVVFLLSSRVAVGLCMLSSHTGTSLHFVAGLCSSVQNVFYACADRRCVVPPPVLRVGHLTRRLALSSWAPGMPRCPRSSPQPEVDESQKPPQLPCPSVGMAPRHTLQAFEVFLDGWSSSCPQGCNLLQKAVFLAAFPSLSHFSASLWLFPGIIFQIYGLHSFPHSLLLGEPRPR